MTQNALTTTTKPAGGLMAIAVTREDVADLAGHVRAKETLRVYASHRREFEAWMAQNGGDPAAPTSEQVAAYLIALDKAGVKTATLLSKRAALVYAFGDVAKTKGIKDVTDAIQRKRAAAMTDRTIKGVRGNEPRKKTAITEQNLKSICANPPQGIKAIRDRAILLVGFWGAFRRSELAGIALEDIEFSGKGMMIRIAKSKTDQMGKGMIKPVAANRDKRICPVIALQAWLSASGIKDGAVFRQTKSGRLMSNPITPQVVALVVKDATRRVGLNPDTYGAHSLRSGFVTSILGYGVSDSATMATTGHKDPKTLRGYDQRNEYDALNEISAITFGK